MFLMPKQGEQDEITDNCYCYIYIYIYIYMYISSISLFFSGFIVFLFNHLVGGTI